MTALAVALMFLTLWAGTRLPPRVGMRRKPRRIAVAKPRKHLERAEALEDLGMIVAEVATRLRAGERTEQAWKRSLERAGFAGQWELDEFGVPHAMRRIWNSTNAPWRVARTLRTGVPAAIAVCRMSKLTGAPTADVLDSCARGITEASEARAARDVALAGPKASARMLSWLPLMGIGFGTIVGARPIAFLTGEWVGHACLLIGAGLEVAGVLWVRRLTRRAEKAS